MLLPRLASCVLFVGLAVLGADGARAQQDYPTKSIRLVASEVGGVADQMARLIAPALSARLGQPVIVDNRAGSMVIRGELLLKSLPDGHNLFVSGNSFWLLPYLQDVTWDPVKDFAPVTMVSSAPTVVVVHPSTPVKSIQELIAVAKARPGGLSYASGLTGAANHLGPELFKAMAGVDIVRIPYKGGAALLVGLLGGEAQLAFAQATSLAPLVKSGRLRALAVTSAEPSALVPGLPTVAASGLPGYEAVALTGLFAPAKTPAAIVNRLYQENVRILNQPDVKEKFFNAGVEAVGSSPQETAIKIKSEMSRMGKVIKDAGIRAE